jgi:putative ABC transport system ATP-binding protein
MAFLEAKNIWKIYGAGEESETIALNDVSFDVNEGEFAAIMGPSGCGKSTLLHIMGLLDHPTKGTFHLDGKAVSTCSDEELAFLRSQKIGFVFQSFHLLPRVSVLENVKMPLIYSGVKEAHWNDMAMKAIESVGMQHRLNHEPSQLSGGEKQRVAIARSLINSPKIIFADEPTGNLDSKSGKVVMEILQSLNEKEGKTVILVTHETYTAEHAERIIKMLDGKIENDSKVASRRKASMDFSK